MEGVQLGLLKLVWSGLELCQVGRYHHVGLCAAHPFTLGIFELSLHQFSLELDRDAEFG